MKRKSFVCPSGKRYGKQNPKAERQRQFFDYPALFHIDPLPIAIFTYRYRISGSAFGAQSFAAVRALGYRRLYGMFITIHICI